MIKFFRTVLKLLLGLGKEEKIEITINQILLISILVGLLFFLIIGTLLYITSLFI